MRLWKFSYKNVIYKQVRGAAMGSPVSAVVANLYMEFFEELALKTSPVKPRVWKRYVDDTFCIMKKGSEMMFLEHLNKVRPSIKFTVELEKDGKLPFLDCLLEVGNDGKVLSTVYRKQTHTDRYLNYRSHHPIHVKRGVIKSLYDRATRVTTHEEDLVKEHMHLKKFFL